MSRDWVHWHAGYDADGPLARRLAIVQRHIRASLDARAGEPISVLSMCSGDGRDLLGVLSEHPAGKGDVAGRLVEVEPTLSAAARRRIRDSSIAGLEVVNEDAGVTTAYIGAAPADLVLACGVFGNLSDGDVERTIRAMPMLCKEDATVIWTRHRRPPDLTPAIRRWFREAGFENIAFETVPDSLASVGVELFRGKPFPLVPDVRLFHFRKEDPTVRKSEIQTLVDYMYWVNHRLLDAAADLSAERFREPTTVTTRDLRATLVHELDVEWSWRLNLQGRADEAGENEELRADDYPDVAALREHWTRDETEMRSWLGGLTDDDLGREVSSVFSEDHRPSWQYVVHIVTHAVQQQADAATLLTLAGRSPGELGFLQYLRTKTPNG